MEPKHFRFWQKWLTYANAAIVVIGLLIALAGDSFLFAPHNHYTREVFFEGASLPPGTAAFKKWLFGIIGATIVGFHTLMIMISENAFKKQEKWAYFALWYGLISWFILDSFISLYYGALYNVVLINLSALFLLAPPLVATRKYFFAH